MDHPTSHNRLTDLAILLLFLVSIFGPMGLFLLQKNVQYSEIEKRKLHPFPLLSARQSITEFSRAFDSYFQDHFGLREWLIHRYQRELSKRFDISSGSDVFEGRDGWLFYAGDDVLKDLKGQITFSNQEKQQFWQTLAAKKKWFAQQGTSYILLVAPNKQSIYPEYLPRHYQQLKQPSRLDDLLSSVNNPAERGLLDLRSRLIREKSTYRLYDRSDTHWNAQGAYLAYQEIMNQVQTLFPGFTGSRGFDFLPDWKNGEGGDLALMIGQRTSIIEQRPIIDLRDFKAVEQKLSGPTADLFALPQLHPGLTQNSGGQLRVLVLHDSFFNKLKPFISESFGDVLYLWQYYDLQSLTYMNKQRLAAVIKTFKPNLVIEEVVERQLPRFLSANTDN
jgi:hypothetical protein